MVISKSDIIHIAKLANLVIKNSEINKYKNSISEILSHMKALRKINIKNISPTSYVYKKKNLLREDEVDLKNMLTQEEALSNAKVTKNGYFVTKAYFQQ